MMVEFKERNKGIGPTGVLGAGGRIQFIDFDL